MRKIMTAAAALATMLAAGLWVASAPRPLDSAELDALQGDASRGAAIYLAAGCGSCHIGPARDSDPLVLSGGREFASDFGTFLAPNISTDPVHGIGGWTQAQFINAVMRGISPDGAHYYPAFPYTSYIRAETQDIADLFAYMQTLPADATPSQPHDLAFPFTLRRAVGLWKALYLREEWVVAGDLTEEETRGRYLAEGLAHCAECHSPRNALGALDHDRWLLGAPNPSGTGRIPAIAGPGFDWTAFDISAYLETGLTPDFDVVGGSMAAVVRSLQHLDKSELDAIAAYILRAAQ
ncbi:MAG: cytochrome c [Roseinatronobacter sp.]|jgi:mono/diheme cytochrome c family protein|nr:cytochrome c [Roseinatronobacter sp.]